MHTDLTDVARRDYLELFIEEIVYMRGNISFYGEKRTSNTIFLLVRIYVT